MAAYHVLTGDIELGRLYLVAGAQSVTYSAVTYSTGQTFRGVAGVTAFTYSGSGTQEVNEIAEIVGFSVEFAETSADSPTYPEVARLSGFAVEFTLNEAEKIVNETTNMLGFSMELVDYPFYSFQITETRL